MATTVPVRARARLGARLLGGAALLAGSFAAAPAPVAHAAPVPGIVQTTDSNSSGDGKTAAERRAAHRRVIAGMVTDGLRVAKRQKGDPYRYGAEGPGAFDCSGLTYYAFRKAGFKRIPRTSSAQAQWVDRIRRKAMRPGDLVFFYDGGGVYHVGVYAGARRGNRFIVHAPYGGRRVETARIWDDNWFAGTLRTR